MNTIGGRKSKRQQLKSVSRTAIETLEGRRLLAGDPTLAGLSLMNATTDVVIKPFADNTVLDLSGGKTYTVAAKPGTGTLGSVVFSVDGTVVRTESFAPYSIAGEVGTDYSPWAVPATAGVHTLVVTPWTLKNGTGTVGTPITVHFTTTGVPAPTFGVTGLTLVNAATNADVAPLIANSTVDFTGGKSFSVRANVTGTATKSVVFKLDGVTVRTEGSAPYSIAGDNPITGGTDYLPWTGLTNGSHTLSVTAYDAAAGAGNAGKSVSVSFTVKGISAPTFGVAGITLVNAATDVDVKPLTAGSTIDFTGNKQLTLRADMTGLATKSVVFKLDGVVVRTENSGPYTIAGDTAKTVGTDYLAWSVTNGAHTLVATAYDAVNGGGNAGLSVTIPFTVTGSTGTVTGGSLGTLTGTKIGGATGSVVAGTAAGSYTVKGSGLGLGGTADQFFYGAKDQSGNFDLKVKLASLSATGTAGIVARGGLSGGNSEVAILYAANTIYFGSRAAFGGGLSLAFAGNGTVGNVWLRLKRVGTTYTAYFGTTGTTWTTAGSVTVAALPTTIKLGLSVGSGSTTEATAGFSNATLA